jgi:hypothetical protein
MTSKARSLTPERPGGTCDDSARPCGSPMVSEGELVDRRYAVRLTRMVTLEARREVKTPISTRIPNAAPCRLTAGQKQGVVTVLWEPTGTSDDHA